MASKKEERIAFVVTSEEKATIEKKAEALGIPTATYCRIKALELDIIKEVK